MDYEERVLGGSELVNRLRQEESLREHLGAALSLPDVGDRITAHHGLRAVLVRRKRREPAIVKGRGLAATWPFAG